MFMIGLTFYLIFLPFLKSICLVSESIKMESSMLEEDLEVDSILKMPSEKLPKVFTQAQWIILPFSGAWKNLRHESTLDFHIYSIHFKTIA